MVNDFGYLWALSQDSGYYVLVVQSESGEGKKLEIVIPWNEREIKQSELAIKVNDSQQAIITPAIVSGLISLARHKGWNPSKQDAPVEMSLRNGELEIRRGLQVAG